MFPRLIEHKYIRSVFVIAAIAFATAGQWALSRSKSVPSSILLYLVAVVLVLAADDSAVPIPSADDVPAGRGRRGWQIPFTIAAVASTALAFTLNASTSFQVEGVPEYQFTAAGVAAWLASIVFFLAAFWQPKKTLAEWLDTFQARVTQWRYGLSIHLSWTAIVLIAIMAIGTISFFYRLDTIPAEMTSDHAEKLLDVNDVLEGHAPVFFIRNTGREPLQFYWTVLLMGLTGLPLSHLALKFGTALIGFLTIPVTFLLAREMFDAIVGVVAAFFVAVIHWEIAIARMGLRYPFTPFFAALSFYFFWRALKYQERNDYLMAGLVLGAGLYGYIPSRNVPLVALGICALWLVMKGWRRIRDWQSFAVNLGLMLALGIVVFAPLLRYSLDFPEMFWYRALTRFTSAEAPVQGNILSIFAQNLANLALAFNWRGDEVWPTNISNDPTFDFVSGALFILGLAIAVFRLVRQRAATYLYLLAAFVALILPSALAFAFPRENPSLVRMGGAIPFAAILIALPVARLWKALRGAFDQWRTGLILSMIGAGVVLVPVIWLNYEWYFVDYDSSYRLSSQNSTEVAAVIRDFANSVGDLQHAYFIGYPYWIDGRAIAINLRDIDWKNFTLDAHDFLVDPKTNLLFIVHPDDSANLQLLREHYPQGQSKTIQSRTPGKDFVSFFVPADPTH